MATVKQVEEAIFQREGFRVKLELLDAKVKSLPPYEHEYMGFNKWKLTEWQSARLAPYIPFVRSIVILRPDGRRTVSDMQLGNLRDAYFKELCVDELRVGE